VTACDLIFKGGHLRSTALVLSLMYDVMRTSQQHIITLVLPARQAIIARQLARLEVVEMGAGSLCYCWARSWWASGRISADAAASSLIQEMIVTTGSSALTRAR
jgi:hypothetical protein